LCGYAIELKLKARICRTLHWATFPSTRAEFQDLTSLKTHKLAMLLQLSGIQDTIRARLPAEWNVVAAWEPEMRYNVVGSATNVSAHAMLIAARALMRI